MTHKPLPLATAPPKEIPQAHSFIPAEGGQSACWENPTLDRDPGGSLFHRNQTSGPRSPPKIQPGPLSYCCNYGKQRYWGRQHPVRPLTPHPGPGSCSPNLEPASSLEPMPASVPQVTSGSGQPPASPPSSPAMPCWAVWAETALPVPQMDSSKNVGAAAGLPKRGEEGSWHGPGALALQAAGNMASVSDLGWWRLRGTWMQMPRQTRSHRETPRLAVPHYTFEPDALL